MEDDILIDNYLKGLLSKDEIVSFNERLKVDTAFNENFKLEEQLFNALNENSWAFAEKSSPEVKVYKNILEHEDLQNLKNTLSETNAEFNTKPSSNSKKLYYYLAAASVIIFLGFQIFFNQNVSNQDLYNDYVGINELPSLVSRSNKVAIKLAEAQMLFEEKKYAEALTLFQSSSNDAENRGNVLIYEGLSLTELGKYKEAEDVFNSLIESDLLDAPKGNWYKALVFLRQNRVEDSKQILNTIILDNLYNKKKAEELLKELK